MPERHDSTRNRIYADLIQTAPALREAQTKLQQAQRDLEQAQLDLRYCTIVAEIDGVITRRDVNPGNELRLRSQLGQARGYRFKLQHATIRTWTIKWRCCGRVRLRSSRAKPR